jgi:hypothetical protein
MAMGPGDYGRPRVEDLVGRQGGMGGLMGGDAFSQAVIEDMLMGRGDQYSPGGIQEDPYEGIDPQQFIQQMLAGDVVPHPGMSDIAQRRFTEPGVPQGSQGAASINQMGGASSPYLDLLNILAFPSGRSMAPPIRR